MPRKIIIASTEITTGGLGSYLMNLMEGLHVRGWEIHLLISNVRGDSFDRVKKAVKCYDLSEVALSPKKVFMAADLANSIKPDVILMNNCALMHYSIPLLELKTRPISVLHSDDPRFYAIGALFSRRVFRWIAPTAGLATRFQEYIGQNLHDRVRVIPHGIDRRRFFPERTRRRGSSFQILFAGFLGESKGADLLPDIFQRVAAEIPDAFLTIVGDGPLRAQLGAEFEKRGLLQRTLFSGAVSPDETAATMRASDVLLLPTNLEGFGMVIVESMMCGAVPVISRLPGVTDQLVKEGETGLLVNPRDNNGFAEAVKRLYRDEELRQTISANAQKTAAGTFSLETMIDRYESLFAEPLDESARNKKSIPGWYGEAAVEYLRKRLR